MNKLRKRTLEIDREQLKLIYSALDPSKKMVKEQLQTILWMSAAEVKQQEIERTLALCLKKKIEFNMFQPELFKKNNIQNRWVLKSMRSIWIMDTKFNWEEDYEDTINIRSPKNYIINYKSWLWEKLHLTWEEIQKFSVERINEKANKLLAVAIDHVERYFNDKNMIPVNLEWRFKSSYYEKIHAKWVDQKTFFDLVRLYYRITKKRKTLIKDPIKNKLVIKELEMAEFEIQRIFGLAVLYNDREKNHEFEKLDQDKIFIGDKFWELLKNDNGEETISCPYPESLWENIECPNVTKNKVYITKNADWTYNVLDKEPTNWEYLVSTIFNSAILRWRTEFFKKTEQEVKIRHIAIRGSKSWPAAVDKVIMKWLSSFTEIMDQKWIILVVDSYKDADKIEALLTNEMWTRETSWVEEFKVPWIWNNNQTSSSYNVKKWIMKVSYKAKDITKIIKELNTHLKNLKAEVSKNCDLNPKILEEIKNIEIGIEHLRSRAKKWTYNIEIEIQLFDVANYIKAEFDEKSPAYHGKYKNNQRALDIFPKLFPVGIYWENALRRFLVPVIKNKMKMESVN